MVGGTGTLLAGGALAQLHKDIAVLMRANLPFTFSNTGTDPLVMYVLNEPVPQGFKVGDKMLVIDERRRTFARQPLTNPIPTFCPALRVTGRTWFASCSPSGMAWLRWAACSSWS